MIRQLFRILGPDAASLRGLIAAMLIGAILQGVAFAMLVPLLRALLSGDDQKVWLWLAAEVAIVLAYGAVHYVSKIWALKASWSLSGKLWHRLGDHISSLPLGWFTAEKTGSVARLSSNGVFDVMGLPTNLLRPLMDTFVTPAVVVALMFLFDWRLALITLVTGPLIALAYRLAGNLIQTVDNHTHNAAVSTANRLIEFAQTQPVLRAFGRASDGYRLLDDALVAQRAADRKLLTHGAVGQFGFAIAVQAAFTVILLAGIAQTLVGSIGPVELVALLVLTTRYVQPMLAGADIGGAIRSVRNNLHRMDQIFATPPLKIGQPVASVVDASVEFEGVSFGYDERLVLDQVSFHVPARTMTALVGPSGSGKTTMTRLVGRFWDPNAGSVKVGGADAANLTSEDLMRQLSFVFQDVYLFAGTIRENILMAKPDATEAELAEVVRLARVDELISRLPNGLETQVGEGGSALSGGERQRVSIARAILKDAPIVLLDEATAALDPENEALVQDALSALTANRTLIVVAHRLQTIMAADQIILLESGSIAQRGSHEQLINEGGRYADFWRERQRAQGWRLSTSR